MAFVSGGKILADDFNELVSDTNDIVAVGTGNKGYGGTPLSTVVADSLGNKIDNDEWLSLRNALENAGLHQGSVPALPDADDLEEMDMTQAFPEFETAIDQVTTNRLSVDTGNTTITNGVLTSFRSASFPWSTQIEHKFRVEFADEDAARQFFNTGGQIRLDMTAPDTVAAHNWGGLYDAIGTVIFDHNDYFNLSETLGDFVAISIHDVGAGVYSSGGLANVWSVQAAYIGGTTIRGARGNVIEFRSLSSDNYAGNPLFPGSPDLVVGDFTSTISERRSTAPTLFPQAQPIYTTIADLGPVVPAGGFGFITATGGSVLDQYNSMDLDASNNIYVCGLSTSFGPSAPGAFSGMLSK